MYGGANAPDRKTSAKNEKYLTFTLADEDYGISILKVKEIIGVKKITPIPQTPDHIKGVIRLRESVLPIIDLRLKFGMEALEYDHRTCIIIVEINTETMEKCWEFSGCKMPDCPARDNPELRCWMIAGTHCRKEVQGAHHEKMKACSECPFFIAMEDRQAVLVAGIVVDSVSEVVGIKADEVETNLQMGAILNAGYILGMAKTDKGLKILLDVDRLLRKETELIQQKDLA